MTEEIVLQDSEQYRLQMAAISTASFGYWNEGDSINHEYDTPALHDVAALYAKYDAKYKLLEKMAEALQGVIRVADRATVEFDAARAALAAYDAQQPV
jgi:hypothetical protein